MPAHRRHWLGLLLAALELPLAAQVYPGGGYPPGQYPGSTGGVGIPFPRRHKKDQPQAQLDSTSGMLRRIEKDQVIVEADDHRILNFKRTDSTKFVKMGNPIKPAGLKPGDLIEVESTSDEEGFMTAVNVLWQQDGTSKDRAHAAEPVDVSLAKGNHPDAKSPAKSKDDDAQDEQAKDSEAKSNPGKDDQQPVAAKPRAQSEGPDPADLSAPIKESVPAVQIDSDDAGPPVLKRGGSKAHKEIEPPPAPSPEAAHPTQVAENNPPASPESAPAVTGNTRPEEVVIEKAREAAATFLESLPNYFCQEIMTRYQSSSHPANWQPLDVVSMALVYDHGQESYRNIEINGKATKKSVEDLPGAWSTGEFGSVLADLFSPNTGADFEYRSQSRSAGRAAMVYDFEVEREHSHWRIMVASQLIQPSYKGSVWIDKETNRVLRIEMQATHLPEAFPVDHVEMATDYQFVRFGDREFLVPVHADSLACQRGSDDCNRNAIDFRNYHKYAGESTITFEK
ncbi:MAG TPA: hypothetical protein VMT86_03305 [Bryobacteraceae bacterium]|nr:hypothetical protein [Bryobacteraceae bacterium]